MDCAENHKSVGGSERVEIPAILVERLKGFGPRFVRVAKRDKAPVDRGWQKPESWMRADDPRLQGWLNEGGNYGIAAGYGLAIINVDHEDLKELFFKRFPSTFTWESPGRKAPVALFLSNLTEKRFLRTKDGEYAGEILWDGFQALGPGCIHPNGRCYAIINDAPIATISEERLEAIFGEHLVPKKELKRTEEVSKAERRQADTNLSVLKVVPLTGLRRCGDEYYGAHPVHGSTTGRNFWVNPSKNVWHCFRHGTGGGPLLWLAVQEGIVKCEEAGPGVLKGDLFKRVLRRAAELGLVEDEVIAKVGGRQVRATVSPKVVERPFGNPENVGVPFYEQAVVDGELAFIVVKSGRVEIAQEIMVKKSGGFEIIIRPRADLPYPDYRVKREWLVAGAISLEELWAEVKRLLSIYVDFLEDWHLVASTAEVILSYLKDLLQSVPYLIAIGDTESGKTKWCKVMAKLAYRPLYSESLPAADIYEFITNYGSTIIEDEVQGLERDREKLKIYKGGYQRGSKVPRILINRNTGERKQLYYDAYGVKLFAGEKEVKNKGFMDRCVILPFVKGRPLKDEFDSADEPIFEEVRGKLLAARVLAALGALSLNAYPEEPWLECRMKELFKPLLSVTITSDHQILLKVGREMADEKRAELSESGEAKLVLAYIKAAVGNNYDLRVPFDDVCKRYLEELGNPLNAPDPRSIGSKLTRLGFKVERRRGGSERIRYRFVDAPTLKRLVRKYDLADFIEPRHLDALLQQKLGPLGPLGTDGKSPSAEALKHRQKAQGEMEKVHVPSGPSVPSTGVLKEVDTPEATSPSSTGLEAIEGVAKEGTSSATEGKSVTSVTSVTPEAPRRPPLKDLLKELRSSWIEGSPNDFVKLLVERYGFVPLEAERFRTRLIELGDMALDPDGDLRWTRANEPLIDDLTLETKLEEEGARRLRPEVCELCHSYAKKVVWLQDGRSLRVCINCFESLLNENANVMWIDLNRGDGGG